MTQENIRISAAQRDRARGSSERPMTLTEFLLARLAEDEERAGRCQDWPECDPDYGCPAHTPPARVLADVEAKRRIVEMSTWISNQERVPTDRPGVYDVVNTVVINEDMEPVLRYLALPYADHPDYDESWRP